ncbi:hypothetical protein [Psychroflexus tropicus]|uniref:hypothetical protein n=1 Tax=Psychroflexus tropicus TaxID=197345 RepID=UPI00037564C3|nr:hypothetical protein [Psychroflexus tropicus]
MKFFKYLFFLLVLIFVVGSLYIATISIPDQENFTFETPVNAKLFSSKVQDLSTYETWFDFPQESISEQRLSNVESPKNTTLSWQNEKFESINFQNRSLTEDSLIQRLRLKTWLSSSEFDMTWKFITTDANSRIEISIESEASFWQKTELVLTGTSHLEQLKKALSKSLSKLEQSIIKEIAIYNITPIGKVETGGFYILHATSAARLNFKNILKKSQPVFKSIEQFINEQNFNASKDRIILFENLYENSESIIFSSGIGMESQVAIPASFEVLSKPVRKSIYFKTQLTGDYLNLKELLAISKSTLEDRELTINTALKPFLEFEVDESQTINPSKWVTNFYIPVIEN